MTNSKINWTIFGAGVFGYMILFIIDNNLFHTASSLFFTILRNITPALLLIFFLLFIVNLTISTKWIAQHFGKKSGKQAWVFAIVGGMLSSGPIYMWYPLLSDLRSKGATNALITTFLYNRAIKIPLIPLMVAYFHWLFVIVLTMYMIIFSIVNGIIVDKVLTPRKEGRNI